MTVAVIAIVLQGGMLFLALFNPGLAYIVSNPRQDALTSLQFLRTLIANTVAQFGEQTKLEVLTNGAAYYPAELAAIRSAKKSVALEAYIFNPGEIATAFLDAVTERAAAGVEVEVVADAVGSAQLTDSMLKPLAQAGGKFAWYMPLRWYTWPNYNHRTHRELLIVDGKIGFVGGSGWADHWWKPVGKDKQPWRDTMIRVEGPAVTGLQSVASDHLPTRRSSRRLFGDLLKAGAHIYEYQPTMIHAKVLIVDDLWCAIGSTNQDPRSFKLNDE